MSTLKSEFTALASELIDDEFEDFRRTLIINDAPTYDPISETQIAGSQMTVQAIRRKLSYQETQMNDIQMTDFAATYTAGTPPKIGQTGTYDSVAVRVVNVQQDAADAAIQVILRKL